MINSSKIITFLSENFKLTGFLAYPKLEKSVPSVLFIHGGGKYTENLYVSWQTYLSDNGYASLSFYCRGVGTSEGNFEDGSLVNRLKDAFAARTAFIKTGIVDPKRICFYGSSMGAHVAVRMIEKFPETKLLILQSAAAYSKNAEVLPLNEQFTNEIRKNEYFNSPIFPILKKYQGATHVVYGENDLVIPNDVKDLFYKSINIGEYQIIKNGTHKLLRPINELEFKARDELYSSCVKFLNQNV
jgi:alpha/beta superfamily hydrolase